RALLRNLGQFPGLRRDFCRGDRPHPAGRAGRACALLQLGCLDPRPRTRLHGRPRRRDLRVRLQGPVQGTIMSAESNAYSHAESCRWWVGNPEMGDEKAHLHDLLALDKATVELIRQQRDLLGYYDTDAELFGDDTDVD